MLNVPFTDVMTVGCLEDPAGYPNCNLGLIQAGASGSFDITFDVSSTNATVTNIVTVSSDSVDNTPGNDTAVIGASSSVVPVPTLNTWGLMIVILMLINVGLYITHQRRHE